MAKFADFKSWAFMTAAVVATAGVAQAQDVRQFHIPAQSLAGALNDFGRQSGRDILFSSDVVEGRRSQGLQGAHTPERALDMLLAGTGLEYRTGEGGTLLVQGGEGDATLPETVQPGDDRSSENEEGEEVVVTGTRLSGAPTGSPVYAFDRQDFSEAGAGTVEDFMRTVTQNFTGGASSTGGAIGSNRNGNDTNISLGASINLRGLGPDSTLVLLNGRRTALGGLGMYADVSTIPLSAIDRVEVSPDGASAIYGSDAVGGVVNFILRDDYQGAETMLRHEWTPDGGYASSTVSQLGGARWASGSALVNVDFGMADPLLATDRPYTIGLPGGINYLTPDEENFGALIRARQDLSSDLTASITAYGNSREASTYNFNILNPTQATAFTSRDQFGGTAQLDWRLGENWQVTLAQTWAQSTDKRTNHSPPGPLTPFDFLSTISSDYEADATEFEVAGAVFDLPGGALRVAFGAERRSEALDVDRGGTFFVPSANSFERDVSAQYLEVSVPLIGEGNRQAWAHSLGLTGAVRHEDYSDVGEADTYKVGGVWSPFNGVNLRATTGTSFRAPGLFQLDDSNAFAFIIGPPFYPYVGLIVGNVAVDGIGPETADIWTAGFDIEQEVFGIRVNGTYFDIQYRDRIAAPLFTDDLTNPLIAPFVSSPPDPALLAVAATLPLFEFPGGFTLADVTIAFDQRIRNQAQQNVSGFDLSLEREFDTSLGLLNVGANLSKYFSFERQATQTAPPVEQVDTVFNPSDLRVRGHVTWSNGAWSAAGFVNYVDDYVDNQGLIPVSVDSWTTVDISGSYRFGDSASWLSGISLRAAVTNLFDQDPPALNDLAGSYGNPGFDSENANPMGRVVSIEIVKSW